MSDLSWVKGFVEAATAQPAEAAPQLSQLSPLGHTRGQLLGQIARATTLPQTPVVRAYIAEARHRLGAL